MRNMRSNNKFISLARQKGTEKGQRVFKGTGSPEFHRFLKGGPSLKDIAHISKRSIKKSGMVWLNLSLIPLKMGNSFLTHS
jgi:hypothetical protein